MNTSRSRSDRERDSGRPGAPVVHSITAAATRHSDDMDARIRRYLFSMGLRTVCVVLVLVVDGPIRWVFAVLAVILPYIAVVMANAAGGRRGSFDAVSVASAPLPAVEGRSTTWIEPLATPPSARQESHERHL